MLIKELDYLIDYYCVFVEKLFFVVFVMIGLGGFDVLLWGDLVGFVCVFDD